jgi:hypothetical protein
MLANGTAGQVLQSNGTTAAPSWEAGILSSVTEGSYTGVRLSTSNADNHGDIGDNAVDLSVSYSSSIVNGATGELSFAIGEETQASGVLSFASGFSTKAQGDNATAMGTETTASGKHTTAMGDNTTASDYASVVIGQYNSSLSSVTTGGNATLYDSDNTAFVIGNGTGSGSRSDAFKVMFNGDATIAGSLTSGGNVTAGTFTGNITGAVTGNADTATKIASITNTDIVQLTATQTLTNKTLTSPTITGTGAIAGTFTGNLTGNVTGTASAATNLAAGLGGTIPYQSAAGTTAMLTNGTAGQVLQSNGTTAAPSWATPAVTITEVADEDSATVSQTAFTLAQTPSANSKVKMYVNGIRISNTAYTVSGTTLTYIPANNGAYALSSGDRIQFDYFY